MIRKTWPLLLFVVLLAGCALAASTTSDPPAGIPPVLWSLLGVLLPWIYQAFLSKLPGWLKFIVSYGISFAIVAVVGFIFMHYSVVQFLAALGSMLAVMQAIYQLMTKPAAKARAITDSTRR